MVLLINKCVFILLQYNLRAHFHGFLAITLLIINISNALIRLYGVLMGCSKLQSNSQSLIEVVYSLCKRALRTIHFTEAIVSPP